MKAMREKVGGVRRRAARRLAGVLAAAALAPALLAACGNAEPALARGDRLWADSSYREALAEYRLALRQTTRDEQVLARVAHAYAVTGDLDKARESYRRLVEIAPEYRDQAVYDYLSLARRKLSRGDRYDLASAVEAALTLRPELPLDGLAVPLARYYAETKDPARALEFYQRALARAPADSASELLYQIARIHMGEGDCRAAVSYFSAYRERAPDGRRASDARWRTGQCAFDLAREAHESGSLSEALTQLERVIELGVPENLQAQAWFDRGEILYAIGRYDDALESFRRVISLNASRGGRLVDQARERIDQIRFRW